MNNQSLISKISSKQMLTPLEIVTIQYLDRKYLCESNPNIKDGQNPYLVVENAPSLIPHQELRKLLLISEPKKQRAYEYYQWLANFLMDLDNKSVEVGYKGLAILNELRYYQSEIATRFLLHNEENVEIKISLDTFKIYSRIDNKPVTFFDLVESFGRTFMDLITIIDNVLTVNLDLEDMIDTDELKCLKNLKLWFTSTEILNEENTTTQLNFAQICYDNIFTTIIDQNHPEFVELLKTKVNQKGYELFPNFKNDSILYVKNTIINYLPKIK